MDMIVDNGFAEISNVEDVEINGGGILKEIAIDIGLLMWGGPIIAPSIIAGRHIIQDLSNCYRNGYDEVMYD